MTITRVEFAIAMRGIEKPVRIETVTAERFLTQGITSGRVGKLLRRTTSAGADGVVTSEWSEV